MPLSLVMDIVIATLLAVTIFYAIRLSKHLDDFRSNRSAMERLIRDLSSQITRAQEGVTHLDDAARASGQELRKLIEKATGITDELDIMTESGNKVAERLDSLASRNRDIADNMTHSAAKLTYPGSRPSSMVAEKPKKKEAEEAPKKEEAAKSFFSIRDPDFRDSSEDDGLSQSERQLAAALRRKKGDV